MNKRKLLAGTVTAKHVEFNRDGAPPVSQQIPRNTTRTAPTDPELWSLKADVLRNRGRSNSLYDIMQAAIYLKEAATEVEMLRSQVANLQAEAEVRRGIVLPGGHGHEEKD